ncbi:hypothetical protein G4B88_002184 [Cannabis sativa]|uniref:EF-hand domain-containing protein n=1 Tax=Cannabis sativa TaxID=3483 RepID=A0A7J6E103_CANSA|nr:hypothetical protein G4B88_002184 [Cannabis sativa]
MDDEKQKNSSKYAMDLFDAVAARRHITRLSINKAELYEFWEQITDENFDSRLQTFFDMVDKDYDGRINKEDVKNIIKLSANANNSAFKKSPIMWWPYFLYQLETLLQQGILENPRKKKLDHENKESNTIKRYHKGRFKQLVINMWRGFWIVKENWRRIWVVGLWLAICVGLFTWKFIQYKNRAVFEVMGYCVTAAKGAAETLKFNMALILLPVCRNTITLIRTKTMLGVVVPFNDNINFHKAISSILFLITYVSILIKISQFYFLNYGKVVVIAGGIAIGVGVHAGAHLTCDFPRLLHATDEQYKPMEQFFGKERPNNYWWFLKGTEGWTGLVMVFLMVVAFTFAPSLFRQNKRKLPKAVIKRLPKALKGLPEALQKFGGFNTFWYSHHLFVIVYILFLVHGYYLYLSKKWYKKTTWMYVAVPILLYACERLIRAFRYGFQAVNIEEFKVFPGNVLALQTSKPQGFEYSSGQYIYLNCSFISPFEWHPFSLTSAPDDDYLSVHIRGSAFGAPAQDYKEYKTILLVGLGIGATPLISIVKDVLNKTKQKNENELNEMESGNKRENKKPSFATERAYFYWSSREEGSFQWFKGAMDEVAEKDMDHMIEVHNYCTNARSAFITMLQTLYHAKNGLDAVSQTRFKTHFSRPNWEDAFNNIAAKHVDQKVGVFYCGPISVVPDLKKLCLDFSLKGSTKFVFHKENF